MSKPVFKLQPYPMSSGGRHRRSKVSGRYIKGGSAYGTTGRFLGGSVLGTAGRFIKDNKLVSKGLSAIPHPLAQAASTVAGWLGLGRRKGHRRRSGHRLGSMYDASKKGPGFAFDMAYSGPRKGSGRAKSARKSPGG
jgi:hypothetical protein